MENNVFQIFDNDADNLRIYADYNSMQNYCIDCSNCTGEYVYVFFSSHALYFPTTYEEYEKIKKTDYYEWKNIASNPSIRKNAYKIVFLRDIYKNWYLKGINNEINSVEKLAQFIIELAEGKRIVTVGSSGGGYASILLGVLIGADTIFAFSPQTDLDRYNDFHEYRYHSVYVSDENYKKYVHLDQFMLKSKGDLNYFYPAQSPEDIAMYDAVKNCDKTRFLGLRKSEHGVVINSVSLIDILSDMGIAAKAYNRAMKLSIPSRPISPIQYLLCTSGGGGIVRTLKKLINRFLRQKFL